MHRLTQLPLTLTFFLLGIVTRLPFITRYCRPGDMGNFVLAMDKIDLAAGNPQMPGMFVVFIYLGRLFNTVLHNPSLSLSAVNVIASGIAAATLYHLGKHSFSKTIGVIAGLLTLTSPLIWYQGSSGLSHMIEFAWVAVIMATAYWTGLGDRRALYFLGFAMGIAGGIRPSTPIFMLPIALFAAFRGIWTQKLSWADFIGAFVLGLGAIALWFIPLIQSAGGWTPYWDSVQAWLPLHTERKDADSIVKVIDNLFVFLKALFRGVGLGLIPFLGLWWKRKPNFWKQLYGSWPLQVAVLTLLPGMLVFLLVHLRRKEQVMTIIPAVVMLTTVAIAGLSERWHQASSKKRHRLAAIIIILNGLFFLLGPSSLPTARNILEHNADTAARLDFIRNSFNPETTAILTHPYSVRLGEVYYPDFQERWLGTRVTEEQLVLDEKVDTLVLLDDRVFRKEGQDDGFTEHPLIPGTVVRSRSWEPGQRLWVTKFTSGIVREDEVSQSPSEDGHISSQ